MKTGQDSMIPEQNITNEDIATAAAPFIVYMQKALEVCDTYVIHCGRPIIQPEDIARCLAYTAQNLHQILQTDSTKQDMFTAYEDILRELDAADVHFHDIDTGGPTDDEDIDNDLVSEDAQRVIFKNCVTQVFLHLRNAGYDPTEAATRALEIAQRGLNAFKHGTYCKSVCPCRLCTQINEHFANWDSWTPSTVHEKSIQNAVQNIINSNLKK